MRHWLRHFFLPHHTNNHRAKALHPDTLLVYILMFAVFNFGIRFVHRAFPEVLGYATDIHVESLLSDTNRERAKAGLGPLTLNSQLSAAAAGKAADMFRYGYWAHNSPQGKTPWVFITGSGYRYTLAGENLAKNFSTSQAVVDAWMASPTHRANIVKPGYRDIGFAVVNGHLNGEETTLVVQMFGARQVAEAVPEVKPVVEIPATAAEVAGEHTPQLSSALEQNPTPAPVERVVPAGTVSEPFKAFTQFASVIRKPVFNIPTVTRDASILFIGLIIGVLAIDGWMVARKRIIRVSGHNIAHILFFLALFIALVAVKRGTLL